MRNLKMFCQIGFLGGDEVADFTFELLRDGFAVIFRDVAHQGVLCDGTVQALLALVCCLLIIKM